MTFEVVYVRDDGTIESRSMFFLMPFKTKQAALAAISMHTMASIEPNSYKRVTYNHLQHLQVRAVKRKKK